MVSLQEKCHIRAKSASNRSRFNNRTTSIYCITAMINRTSVRSVGELSRSFPRCTTTSGFTAEKSRFPAKRAGNASDSVFPTWCIVESTPTLNRTSVPLARRASVTRYPSELTNAPPSRPEP
uniref:(northern house mosquito) hypothetical protein n=1 Tax=Culex pipiens TaxID=7175 RepID=A0A8D8K0H9_CULPI